MYRTQEIADILGRRNVASVAVDVHSTTCGSCERPDSEQEADILALRDVIMAWKGKGSNKFDDAVYDLISAALTEYDKSIGVKWKIRVRTMPHGFRTLFGDCTYDEACYFFNTIPATLEPQIRPYEASMA